MMGSGWNYFKAGTRLKYIRQLNRGDVILMKSIVDGVECRNVVKISVVGLELAYGKFVNPKDLSKDRMEGDIQFAIWDFQLESGKFYEIAEHQGEIKTLNVAGQ